MTRSARLTILVALSLACLASSTAARAQGGDVYTLRKKAGQRTAITVRTAADARALTVRLLTRKIGAEQLKRLLQELNVVPGQSEKGSGGSAAVARWSIAGIPRDTSGASGVFVKLGVQDVMERTLAYGSFPGGVTIEGDATGLAEITTVQYDARFNAFEGVVLSQIPQLARLMDSFVAAGAWGALLSGSGSSLYSLARTEVEARAVAAAIAACDADVRVMRTRERGVTVSRFT